MNLLPQLSNTLRKVSVHLLAFFFLGSIASAAAALDLTRYMPLNTGNQWSYKNNNLDTATATIGSPVVLPSGVSAIPETSVKSTETGYTTTYYTNDNNGLREHGGYSSSVNVPGYGYTSASGTFSPPAIHSPANPVLGGTYTSSGTVTLIYTNVTTVTLSYNASTQIVGFETVTDYSGSQSWLAVKVISSNTVSGTVNGQYIADTTASTQWLVDGIGIVQYSEPNKSGVMETWKLTSTNVVPPTTTTTTTTTTTSTTTTTLASVGIPGSRYFDNRNGTVTDPITGLTWMRCSMGQTWDGSTCTGTGNTYLWNQASALTGTVTFAGQSDWRLPNLAELQSLVDTAYFPYINPTAFPNTPAWSFWSSSPNSNSVSPSLQVAYFAGASNYNYYYSQVRLVRIGQSLNSSMLNLVQGWNLVGNSSSGSLDAITAFGDTTKVSTVWKWIANGAKWAFYAPSLVGQALSDYAISKGYDVLTTINGGEGFWVNAATAFTTQLPAGTAITSTSFQTMASGWNLIAIGDNKTPSQFNTLAAATPLTTLWAWDATQTNWYFYAPSLDNAGTLSSYIASKGYLDFGAKTLDPATGFWVNKP